MLQGSKQSQKQFQKKKPEAKQGKGMCKPLKDLKRLITPQSSQPLISHSPPRGIKRLSNLLPAGSGASKVLDAEINGHPYGQLK